MAVDSCATENPVAETFATVPTNADETAGASDCGIASPGEENSTGEKKRPSPVPVSESKYESPMKKVPVELVAEDPVVEVTGGDDYEGTGSPVEESSEEKPTDNVIAEEETAQEKPEEDEAPRKASQEKVAESTPPGEVEAEVKTSEPVEVAEGD